MSTYEVAVYGATGHTGRFVSIELERRGVFVRKIARGVMPGGPSIEDGSRWMRASCDEPDALDRALDGAGAVINCAGPFIDTAPALVEAALRNGTHYLDLAAEQRSVRQTLATYAGEAVQSGIVVLPAMAFYGGLADLLAGQLCAGHRTVDEVLIGIALSHWHPTAGTRRTGERNTARRVVVSEGRLVPLPAPPPRGRWRFPGPIGDLPVAAVPLSEIITISKHIAATRIESFLNEAPLRDLATPEKPPYPCDEVRGNSTQTFVMDVAVTCDGESKRIAAFGRDIYAVSAPLIVEACMRLLSRHERQAGTFAPAELFEPRDFLAALSGTIRIETVDQRDPITTVQ
jgi:short subunit dehydrogenase-like uncharacterized protein